MPILPAQITIGQLAARSGVAASALRFYDARGLITAERTAGNQRIYARSVLRRVALIRAAQKVGLSLDEIVRVLDTLPAGRTPGKRDWERLSRSWHQRLAEQIQELEALQGRLAGCIGCGCLSLRTCRMLNCDDRAATRGSGPRYLLADEDLA